MDTNPEEYASSIQKYADTYFQKREELSVILARYNRRIYCMFLFDRCMNSGVLLASLVVIFGVWTGSRVIGIFGGLAIVCMSVAPIVAGMSQALDAAFAKKRELEDQLEMMDQAWRHWSTS